MTPRFVPVLELPDDWSGAITVVVRDGQVVVVDEHPDDVAPGVAAMVLGTLDGAACWAVDLDGDGIPDITVDGLVPLMALYGRVEDVRWTLAGRAVQLVEWDRTTRYCGRCSTPTEPAPGERARRCPACGLLAFPRLAPAVITLIERDGEALLARGRAFPMPMYSCVAGFVEPGETLEDAVRREVYEEAGVLVGDVTYAGSQPWPLPASLMLGFTGKALTTDIEVDGEEIQEARWWSREDARAGAEDGSLVIPPGISISRALITGWYGEDLPGSWT